MSNGRRIYIVRWGELEEGCFSGLKVGMDLGERVGTYRKRRGGKGGEAMTYLTGQRQSVCYSLTMYAASPWTSIFVFPSFLVYIS